MREEMYDKTLRMHVSCFECLFIFLYTVPNNRNNSYNNDIYSGNEHQ